VSKNRGKEEGVVSAGGGVLGSGVEGGRVRVWLMKIVSWNVRGLGGLEERKEVRELAREK